MQVITRLWRLGAVMPRINDILKTADRSLSSQFAKSCGNHFEHDRHKILLIGGL
jgi:hypothetical protein